MFVNLAVNYSRGKTLVFLCDSQQISLICKLPRNDSGAKSYDSLTTNDMILWQNLTNFQWFANHSEMIKGWISVIHEPFWNDLDPILLLRDDFLKNN